MPTASPHDGDDQNCQASPPRMGPERDVLRRASARTVTEMKIRHGQQSGHADLWGV